MIGKGEIWVIVEERRKSIHSSTYELLAKSRELGDCAGLSVTAVRLSDKRVDDEKSVSLFRSGADRVIDAIDERLAYYDFSCYINALSLLLRDHHTEIILAAATTSGRSFMPGLAAVLQTGLTADCTGLEIEPDSCNLIQTRPAIGGNILATIETPAHRPQLATVRPKTFESMSVDYMDSGEVIEMTFPAGTLKPSGELLSVRQETDSAEAISDAEVIIAGGMGLKKQENLSRLTRLAELVGGTVGASRKLVDLKWLDHSRQVGLSGHTVRPRLYMAVGVSGAVQHVAGMQTSEFIIAINKDRHASIMSIADIAIVGDASEILQEISDALENEGREQNE